MGKVKRWPSKHTGDRRGPPQRKASVARRQHSQQNDGQVKKTSDQRHGKSPHTPRLKIPFTRADSLLLVGEGDFSFSLSLRRNLGITQMVTTCYDPKDTLDNKYPGAQHNVTALVEPLATESQAGDTGELRPRPLLVGPDVGGETGAATLASPRQDTRLSPKLTVDSPKLTPAVQVLYGIDATKLSTAHKKLLRPFAPFTKIVFNFPHVGGRSTDVNRQVRYNQELLVGFFTAAKGLLSSPQRPAKRRRDEHDESSDLEDPSQEPRDTRGASLTSAHGQILVTLFEGEPYTLWNIRDLARHSGLRVVESFRFPWSAYPGYRHARTLGDITIGKDRTEEGKRKGAWRGEEREARCYVLEHQAAAGAQPSPRRARQRDKRNPEDDDDLESDN